MIKRGSAMEASFLSLQEAHNFTGYSKAYLYKLTCQGRIPHYKPQGGKIFFKQEELEAFLGRGRRAADYELAEKADAVVNRGRA
jgi:excisionase family DNA binding protein